LDAINQLLQLIGRATAAGFGIDLRILLAALGAEGAMLEGLPFGQQSLLHLFLPFGKILSHAAVPLTGPAKIIQRAPKPTVGF